MMQKIKVLIGDDTAEYGRACGSVLETYGFSVTICHKDGSAVLEKIRQESPEVCHYGCVYVHDGLFGRNGFRSEVRHEKTAFCGQHRV